MLLPRQTRGFSAIFALIAGTCLQSSPSLSEVQIWSPAHSVQSDAGSGVHVWSPAHPASENDPGLPKGVDETAPETIEAAPPPPPEKHGNDRRSDVWSVKTVTPSYRHYRLRRALGQRYTGFKRQYRGQRYTGFARFPRIRRYKVQNSTVKVIPAERRILVINQVPEPHRRRPGPIAVVPAYADLPHAE